MEETKFIIEKINSLDFSDEFDIDESLEIVEKCEKLIVNLRNIEDNEAINVYSSLYDGILSILFKNINNPLDISSKPSNNFMSIYSNLFEFTYEEIKAQNNQLSLFFIKKNDTIFELLFNIVKFSNNNTKSVIVKRLLQPFCNIISTLKDTKQLNIEFIQSKVWELTLYLYNENKDALSILLCVQINSINKSESILKCDKIWSMIQLLMQSTNIIIRRRGAYLFEQLTLYIDSMHSNQIIEFGMNNKRGWWNDFKDCYKQIEEASSLHLVAQIWPMLDFLATKVAQIKESKNEENYFPVLNFGWLKILFQLAILSDNFSIKRAALVKIFRFELLSPLINEEGIEWISSGLLAQLDNSTLFSTDFLFPFEDISFGNYTMTKDQSLKSKLEEITMKLRNSFKAQLDPISHPGLLIPMYLGNIVVNMRKNNEINLLAKLVNSVIRLCFGPIDDHALSSASAVKWIIRAFSEERVYSSLPHCIGKVELDIIKSYIEVNF